MVTTDAQTSEQKQVLSVITITVQFNQFITSMQLTPVLLSKNCSSKSSLVHFSLPPAE